MENVDDQKSLKWVEQWNQKSTAVFFAQSVKHSPYHNVWNDVNYPEVFFTTSTHDDRVHPGHARKMAASMSDMGHKVYNFENMERGHAGASTNEHRVQMYAQIYTYLHMKLMDNKTSQAF